MSKGSGSTRKGNNTSSGVVQSLKSSSIWGIAAGMSRYDEQKNDIQYDFSDMRNLSDTDRTYLVAYLSNAYRPVNEALRSGNVSGDVKKMVSGIDAALSKADKFEGEVYRGVHFNTGISGRPNKTDKANFEAYLSGFKSRVGKEVAFDEYLSAGAVKSRVSRKFASDETSVMFTIRSKNGRDFRRYNDEEHEVLFKRGSRFRITSVRGKNVYLEEI